MSVNLSPFEVAVVISTYAVPPGVAAGPDADALADATGADPAGVLAAGVVGDGLWVCVPGEHAAIANPAMTTRLRARTLLGPTIV